MVDRETRLTGDSALVRNAADEKQVKRGDRVEARRRERELADLRAVLHTVEGRRFLWTLIEHCGVRESSYSAGARGDSTVFNEGIRKVGIYVGDEIEAADADAGDLMRKEARARARGEAIENVASRTPSAEAGTEEIEETAK